MIERAAQTLRSCSLSILEVGGAFGHRFRSLIEFLRLTTLIITDLDSVEILAAETDANEEDNIDFEEPNEEHPEEPKKRVGKSCWSGTNGAVTSNQMLLQWLPAKRLVEDLLSASAEDKSYENAIASTHKVRVAYQTRIGVTWKDTTVSLAGRTLEEAFGLENAEWCQHVDQRGLGLKLRSEPANPEELAKGLHKRVKGSAFDKTKFALGVLSRPASSWKVPQYIEEGLQWLAEEVSNEPDTGNAKPADNDQVQVEAAE